MNFQSTRQYVDVCLDYAMAYSEYELSNAYGSTLSRICNRNENLPYKNKSPIEMGPDDVFASPRDIEGGLKHFIQPFAKAWPNQSFAEYFQNFKKEMAACYVPFRSFSEKSFEDALRLRVYQDAVNIIAGRDLENATSRKYSRFSKLFHSFRGHDRPEL